MDVAYLHPYLSYRHYPVTYGSHVHAELASIHHDHLLREQAELQKYYRTSYELNATERIAAYEAQIRAKQLRIQNIANRSKEIEELEKLRLRGGKVDQLLRREQILRQMQVDKYLLVNHRRPKHYHSRSLYQKNSTVDKENYHRKGILQNKNKQEIHNKKKRQLFSSQKNRQEQNSYLSHRKQFDSQKLSKEKELIQKSTRQKLSRSERGSVKKDYSKSAYHPSKRIQKRLQVASVTYKDSEWKNIKHELLHLQNYYQKEQKQRQELKSKINKNPKIIHKYNIVVDRC